VVVTPTVQGGDLRAALDGPQGAQYLWHGRGSGIAADIACGLAYIHITGVVHRCPATAVLNLALVFESHV
jgi:serine/threonine protein kinase